MSTANAHTPENWRARCDWCGWNLDPEGEACRPFDCSMRPRPKLSDTDLRQECRKAEAQNAALLAALQRIVDARAENIRATTARDRDAMDAAMYAFEDAFRDARRILAQAQKGTP